MNIALMMVLVAAAEPGLWTSIVGLAVQILTPILLVLASWAAVKLAKKFHLEGLLADGELAKDAVHAGIGYAERWAKKYDIGDAFSVGPTGPQKLAKAIEYIAAIEGKLKLGDKVADAISRRIHAELGLDDLTSVINTIIGAGPTTPDE